MFFKQDGFHKTSMMEQPAIVDQGRSGKKGTPPMFLARVRNSMKRRGIGEF